MIFVFPQDRPFQRRPGVVVDRADAQVRAQAEGGNAESYQRDDSQVEL